MGMYKGYRVMARVNENCFAQFQQVQSWEYFDGPSKGALNGLAFELDRKSTYFEFEYDNHGQRIDARQANEQPLQTPCTIDAYFSSKFLDAETWAHVLSRELVLEEGQVVPFMMAQYEEAIDLEFLGKIDLFLARLKDGQREFTMVHVPGRSIEETTFTDAVVLDAVTRTATRTY